MCGRYTLTTEPDLLGQRFALPHLQWQPRYNIAPSQPILTIVSPWEPRILSWGLIPPWSRDGQRRFINARGETAPEKPSFQAAFRNSRCLILADSFFEWDRQKKPYRFLLAQGEPFAMAGLWARWTSPDGEQIETCAIITTEANELVAPIHDRMPVILTRETERLWLKPGEPAFHHSLLRPYPADEMRCYPVSRLVNSPHNDHPGCIAQA
ncbi:MAG: SOS response-associated peptidase [Limnochordia bacterium]|jgi:putative SOS response-associated peptidase YedK